MPEPVSANYPKFSNDELFRFIIEYSKHPELYEFDHPLYTNFLERNKHFQLIADNLQIEGLTAERVRAKIKVFRGNYTHRLKDFYRKQNSGEPFSAPRWWHLADQFLRPFIRFHDPDISGNLAWNHSLVGGNSPITSSTAREAEVYFGSGEQDSGSVEITETTGDDEEDAAVRTVEGEATVETEQFGPDNNIYVELNDEQLMAIENGEMTLEEVTEQAEAAAQMQLAMRNQPSQPYAEEAVSIIDEEIEQDVKPRPKKRKAAADVDSDQEPEDEFDAFGRCVALQLKTLPVDTALQLESEIHALIRKKRMTAIRNRFKR